MAHFVIQIGSNRQTNKQTNSLRDPGRQPMREDVRLERLESFNLQACERKRSGHSKYSHSAEAIARQYDYTSVREGLWPDCAPATQSAMAGPCSDRYSRLVRAYPRYPWPSELRVPHAERRHLLLPS